MGLAISVGVLAGGPDADPEAAAYHRKGLRQVNRLLAASGLPPHEEPESLPPSRTAGSWARSPTPRPPTCSGRSRSPGRPPPSSHPFARGKTPPGTSGSRTSCTRSRSRT
jgi:hypothetical protein